VNYIAPWGLSASDKNNNQVIELTRAQNIVLGIGEMVLGVVLFVGGPVLAGTISAIAPPASTAAFSTVGHTGVIVGGGLIAVGLVRVAGGYNGSFLNDLKSVIVTPMAEAFTGIKR
jgi:hypothetical protein